MPAFATVKLPAIIPCAQRLSSIVVIALIATLVGCGGGSGPDGNPPGPDDRPGAAFFAPGSFWNELLPDDAPIDESSESIVGELVRQVEEYGSWLNTDQFSTPLYTVDEDQATTPVVLDRPGCCPLVEEDFREVPIPDDAVPAEGSDGHLTVWQPSTDTLWEFWKLRREGDGWSVGYGGRLGGVSTSDGVLPVGGASATSLPVIGGTILIDEAEAEWIPHALALAIPFPQKDIFVSPALRTDGEGAEGIPEAAQVPEGARFRLPPDFDIESQDWHPFTKVLARAAQRHGIVLRDKAGAVVMFGEDYRGRGDDPWPGLLGADKGEIMGEFPWADLQLLGLGERFGG